MPPAFASASGGFASMALMLAGIAAAPLLLAGCSDSSPIPPSPTGISIKASDTDCLVATSMLDSGTLTFAVSNAGSQVTEVFVYAAGDRVVGEVQNVGPSTSKRLTVGLKPGNYQIACRPGMVGKDIRTPITVRGPSGTPSATSPELNAAIADYRKYVVAQAALLAVRVKPFAAAIQAGDVMQAKALYPAARIAYETIEPIAQALGDLDSRIDARIDDVESGQQWTGFHRLENDLWTTGDISRDGPIATQLTGDIANLVGETRRIDLSAGEVASAARSLMTSVASSKITGEEERYSRLDLVDVAASVDGSERAYVSLRSIIAAVQPDLVTKIDTRYAALKLDLAQYGVGASFPPYDALAKTQVDALEDDVSALIGPLGQFTTAVLKQ